jgi:hypothetical protein
VTSVAPVKFYSFSADLAHAKHDFSTAVLKLVLTNTQPSLAATSYGDLVETADGGGYLAGGFTLTTVSSGQVYSLYKLILQDYLFTATGNVNPFRYAVVYNSSSIGDLLIARLDYGATIGDMVTDEEFLFDFNGSQGFLTY